MGRAEGKIGARKTAEKRTEQTPSFASALSNSTTTGCEEIVESKLCKLAVEFNVMPVLTEGVPPSTNKHSAKKVLRVGEIETSIAENMALQLSISDQKCSVLNEKLSITFRDVQVSSGSPQDKKHPKVDRTRRREKSARERVALMSRERNDEDTLLGTEADAPSVSSDVITRSSLRSVPEKGRSDEVHDDDGSSLIMPTASGKPSSSVISASDAHDSFNSFLSDPKNFMIMKENKLRLWQSLCIEMGFHLLVLS
ncbi:hypothetical protein C362_04796 [Cryptococcus neoformans Bt1]|nr:hypothetical protein C362_04796 [Cryptococcus neoformans var. grubii Bt1]